MSTPESPALADVPAVMPDHTQLPDQDGSFVRNFQEPPQTNLLTESLRPRLQQLHPDNQYAIGMDSGIYWRHTQPVLDGCKSPDWYYIPGVPPMLDGQFRRSYVMWKETIAPLLIVECVSGDGSEEHDATPYRGKFWVYEQGIRGAYYAIFDGFKGTLEVYRLVDQRYQRMAPNAAGRFPIAPLQIELGLWEGTYWETEGVWLRAWDAATGQLMLTNGERMEAERERAESAESLVDDSRRRLDEETERAEAERHRADQAVHEAEAERRRTEAERQRAEAERQRADQLAEKLRQMGMDPNAL